MGYDFFNVLPVRAGKPAERDVLVPDTKLAAFTQQALNQLDLRTLAQIVSSGLEAEPEYGNFPAVRALDCVYSAIQLARVAWQD